MAKSIQISGTLTTLSKLDWRKIPVQVDAIINGKVVASCPVNSKGAYNLTFQQTDLPRKTELRISPVTKKALPVSANLLSYPIAAARFTDRGRVVSAVTELMIPERYLQLLLKVTQTYQLSGIVYAQYPTYFETIPGVKLEFYEVDPTALFWPLGTEPPLKESFLGYTYAGPDGSYNFDFSFSYLRFNYLLFQDTKPDILVRISQFIDGVWQHIYTGEVDWNIEASFHRDYLVPCENVIPIPAGGVKPAEGFRFLSLGLIPIDEGATEPHFSKGYVTCYPGDPNQVKDVWHQPLCQTLRVFGLFADTPPVATYEVQLAEADENGPTGSWETISDALYNRKWNSVEKRWDHTLLGPDPVTRRYTNIDTEPEADWHEHGLKFTWNSVNRTDGYYVLRVIGYDAGGHAVITSQMPVVRIDNSVPEISLKSGDTTSPCGHISLDSARCLSIVATAYDAEGHLAEYAVAGTRGNLQNSKAGDDLVVKRPAADLTWTGIKSTAINFAVDPLPSGLATCGLIAYNIELHVWGLSTNGYSRLLSSQHDKREINLIVSE